MRVFGDNPVLPKEAQNLGEHVENCAIRYSNLARVLQRLQINFWVYQALLTPAIIYIVIKLSKL